jgi:hypothetical protein
MGIFGRKVLSLEEQRKRQAKERLANIRNIEEARRKQTDYNKRLDSLKREAEIESQRARIAGYEARRGQSGTQSIKEGFKKVGMFTRPVTSVSGGVTRELISGIKSMKRAGRPASQRGRAVYVSTSHGLKRVYDEQPLQEPIPPRIKTSEDDDWGTPSAFRGL